MLWWTSEPSGSSCWLTFRFGFLWLFRFFGCPSKQRLSQISGILADVMEKHLVVPASYHQALLFSNEMIKYRISDSYCQLHLNLHDRQCSDTTCTLLKKVHALYCDHTQHWSGRRRITKDKSVYCIAVLKRASLALLMFLLGIRDFSKPLKVKNSLQQKQSYCTVCLWMDTRGRLSVTP